MFAQNCSVRSINCIYFSSSLKFIRLLRVVTTRRNRRNSGYFSRREEEIRIVVVIRRRAWSVTGNGSLHKYWNKHYLEKLSYTKTAVFWLMKLSKNHRNNRKSCMFVVINLELIRFNLPVRGLINKQTQEVRVDSSNFFDLGRRNLWYKTWENEMFQQFISTFRHLISLCN